MSEVLRLPVVFAGKKKEPCDCGLCCIMPKADSLNFKKSENTPCSNLMIADGKARCSIYENRYDVCKKYVCERPGAYPNLVAKLDQHILNALSSRTTKTTSVELVKELHKKDRLHHSPIVRSFNEQSEPSITVLSPIKKLVTPALIDHDRQVLNITGVSQFLKNLSVDGSRRLMIWMQSFVEDDSKTYAGHDAWYRMRSLAKIGLETNPNFAKGFVMYQSGEMNLPKSDEYAFRKDGTPVSTKPYHFYWLSGMVSKRQLLIPEHGVA